MNGQSFVGINKENIEYVFKTTVNKREECLELIHSGLKQIIKSIGNDCFGPKFVKIAEEFAYTIEGYQLRYFNAFEDFIDNYRVAARKWEETLGIEPCDLGVYSSGLSIKHIRITDYVFEKNSYGNVGVSFNKQNDIQAFLYLDFFISDISKCKRDTITALNFSDAFIGTNMSEEFTQNITQIFAEMEKDINSTTESLRIAINAELELINEVSYGLPNSFRKGNLQPIEDLTSGKENLEPIKDYTGGKENLEPIKSRDYFTGSTNVQRETTPNTPNRNVTIDFR